MRLSLALATILTLAPSLVRLQEDHQPLASEFQEGSGNVRLVALLSPT